MEEEFYNYVSNYDLDNPKIKQKYEHSLRVMKLQEKYAKLLVFSPDDIELAKIIGLLHDIGRFEQLRVYDTYNDLTTIDHADYSVVQLFDKNQIERFTKKKEWYEIIKFAILNHNKHEIPFCEDERTMKHAKLIRDTDKVDIMYSLGVLRDLNNKATNDPLSPKVVECIMNHESVNRQYANHKNDRYAIQLAFAFNIYHDVVMKEYYGYLDTYYHSLDGEEYFSEIYQEIKKYCEERIKRYERTR